MYCFIFILCLKGLRLRIICLFEVSESPPGNTGVKCPPPFNTHVLFHFYVMFKGIETLLCLKGFSLGIICLFEVSESPPGDA